MVADVSLTSPLAREGPSARQKRVYFSAALSVMLLTLALVAVSTFDGSRKDTYVLEGDGSPGNLDEEADAITEDDVVNAQATIQADLDAQPTQIAAHIRGTQPTDTEEAAAIMSGNGPEGERDMARYNAIDGSHSSLPRVADQIINDVEASSTDVTGKAGASTYENLLDTVAGEDPNDSRGAWLRGSLPNYRAESNYITSGVVGNYEKELENQPTMSVVSGKLPARTVANEIIDDAVKARTSPDCTGTVDEDGVHGIGKGTPPCTAMTTFSKPSLNPEGIAPMEE
jgi:hypothetical protein